MALANPTISTTFVTDYVAEVKHAYQQMGSLLMNTVRLRRGVVGSTAKFPVHAAVEANQKARQGDIVPLNPAHSFATATLEDWYAGILQDDLDLLKTNADERKAAAVSGAGAIGRRADLIITGALEGATTTQAVAATGLTHAKIRTAIETLDGNSVPNDRRWGLVGAHQWQELMAITQFASADYVGASNLPFASGAKTRFWEGINWMMHPNLPTQDAGANRDVYIFHQDAVGLAVGADISLIISYIALKDSHFFNHKLSMGATIIDQAGVVEIVCDDDAAIA